MIDAVQIPDAAEQTTGINISLLMTIHIWIRQELPVKL